MTALLLVTWILLCPLARALTTVTRDFEGLVARAETIFRGTVVDRESLWVGEGPARHVATRVTFQVQETLKGAAAPSQTLEFLGGSVAGKTMRVPGVPQFAPGEKVILFVVGNGVQVCPLVGAFQGRFAVERDAATGKERVLGHDGRPVTRAEDIGRGAEAILSHEEASPRPRSSPPAAGAADPALSPAQFAAAITRKLQERRAHGLAEVQRD